MAEVPPSIEIPAYRILQELGVGGMGSVFLAEQTEPIRRKVALKIIKPGLDTDEIVARFASERQALAMMSHPNIAKVYDAGATTDGRPYFAMEYVRGIPITDYCNQHCLTVEQRLRLFRSVCLAIHHAHQKGVIHRDIKSKNVIVEYVSGEHVAKVIDFGIAMATGVGSGDPDLYDGREQLVGTPEYMSPEQACEGRLGVDTTTDVYALGVLLYELLTDLLPLEPGHPGQNSWDDICRRIRETEPRPPSERLADLARRDDLSARQRQTTSGRLVRRVRGELDDIVLKALAKTRETRYQSASEFAADIGRFLDDLPVSAHSPGAFYRLRKMVARHRLGFGFSGLLIILLIVFSISTTVQSRRIARESERAEAAAAAALEVSDFLIDMFEVSDPSRVGRADLSARDILENALGRVETELGSQPLVRARMRATIGQVYFRMGLYDEARPQLQQALVLRRDQLGDTDLDVAASFDDLGKLMSAIGEFDEARDLLERGRRIREDELGPDHPLVSASLTNLANLAWIRNDIPEAKHLHEEALRICTEHHDEDHPDIARCLNNMGILLHGEGYYAEARTYFERASTMFGQLFGDDHIHAADARHNMGMCELELGRLKTARRLFERTLDRLEAKLGPDHPRVAKALSALAQVHEQAEDPERSVELHRRALAIRGAKLGDGHYLTGMSLVELASLEARTGRRDSAIAHLHRAVAGGHDLIDLIAEFDVSPLHDDPDFLALLPGGE